MRKLIRFLGLIPAKLKKIGLIALRFNEALLNALQSKTADIITTLIPGEADDELKAAIVVVLSKFKKVLTTTDEVAIRKAIALRIGAEILQLMDKNKEPFSNYIIYFQKIYDEVKAK